jgi:hypothetical protein
MKYETPEIIEIGSAETLVLGANVAGADCCSCNGKRRDENLDIDEMEA